MCLVRHTAQSADTYTVRGAWYSSTTTIVPTPISSPVSAAYAMNASAPPRTWTMTSPTNPGAIRPVTRPCNPTTASPPPECADEGHYTPGGGRGTTIGTAMKKLSAGILLYRIAGSRLEVLLVHPGGPFWAKKDLGAWSIPKGEYEDGDDARAAALRELAEETGLVLDDVDLRPLDAVRQRGGKVVAAWAAEHDFDVTTLVSNTFELEWPKGSAPREFPEVDRAEWFAPGEARRKLVPAQAEFVDRLISALREAGLEFDDEGAG